MRTGLLRMYSVHATCTCTVHTYAPIFALSRPATVKFPRLEIIQVRLLLT